MPLEANCRQCLFTFVDSACLQEWIGEFQSATEALIDARIYASALETLNGEREQRLMEFHARSD